MQRAVRPPINQWNRNKSISEANLLATDYGRPYHNMEHLHQLRDPRRASVAEFGPPNDVGDHR